MAPFLAVTLNPLLIWYDYFGFIQLHIVNVIVDVAAAVVAVVVGDVCIGISVVIVVVFACLMNSCG